MVLHGDLHHDNILQNSDDWLVIDPKGVIGEPAYEVEAFIMNPISELRTTNNAKEITQNRIEVSSNHLICQLNGSLIGVLYKQYFHGFGR